MKKWLIIGILMLAAGLRLYAISFFPAGLNADEAALGYNAYSLLLTGRDEHGHPMPINLESFGDFKPAMYAYILIPFVKVLGLTQLAVRLPSAIFGIVGVLFIFLLVKESIGEEVALLSALALAISPWHLHFSRGAWEANVATTFLLVGAWGFVKWLKTSNPSFFIVWGLSLIFSMYTYQSARVVAPLLGMTWGIIYWRQIWDQRARIWKAGAVLVVLLVPLVWSVVTTGAGSRFSGVGLLADLGPVNRAEELRGQHKVATTILAKVLHNRLVLYSFEFLKNYTDHFGGDFLFVNGDVIGRNRVPETGLLYLTDLILVFMGVVYLISHSTPYSKIIWWWLVVAPVASGMTFQTPNALRSHNMVVPLTILVALGIYSLKTIKFKKEVILLLIIIYAYQLVRYLHQYYIHYPQTYPASWEYGFAELVPYVESVKGKYQKILVTDKYDQPYILFLFFSKYLPSKFQSGHELTVRDKFNFSTVRDYDKYHFAPTPWDKVRDVHSALIVAAPEDIPEVGVNIVKTIYFPSGQPAFKIVSN